MHEAPSSQEDLKPGSDRSFGLVFGAVFLLVAVYPVFHGSPLRLWAAFVCAALLVVASIRPVLLNPLNVLWFRFGLLLNKIVTPLVMGVLYVAMIVPVGLCLRLAGKDPLALRFDPAATTYWRRRDPGGASGESLRRQF